MTKKDLKLEQKNRILRVYALAKLYSDYRDIYLSECLLKCNTTYFEAEKTSDFINSIFKGDTKACDFIKNEDELINELISKTKIFKYELEIVSKLFIGLNDKLVMSFCKDIEHGNFHILKSNIGFIYQIHSLLNYYNGSINKDEFLYGIQEFSIFTKKRKFNNKLFKKTFLSIESKYYEIINKQIIRKQTKHYK
jgi:hypothetical protein